MFSCKVGDYRKGKIQHFYASTFIPNFDVQWKCLERVLELQWTPKQNLMFLGYKTKLYS